MPTYDYECQKCGHRFEEFQSMKDKPLTRCPQCRGKVKRLIGTGAGFLFKGSGFYTTDYRSSAYQEKKKKESGSPSAKPAVEGQGSPQGKGPSEGRGSVGKSAPKKPDKQSDG